MEKQTKRVTIDCSKDGVTQQNFKEECNINTIVEKARLQGVVAQNAKQPDYIDVSKIPDYQTALNTVLYAQQSFIQLPAKVRDRFANDPSRLMDFIANDENYEEAVKLGLVAPKPPKIDVPIVENPITTSVPQE